LVSKDSYSDFEIRAGFWADDVAIVDVAKVQRPGPKAANRWNTYEITARGDRMVVVLNGQQTVDGHDGEHSSAPIALQSAAGTIRFRKVEIRRM
jgi:hypothetical protein